MQEIALGQLQLYVLDDGTWRFPAHFYFHDVPETLWRPLVNPDTEGKIPVGHNYGLLKTADELIVMDTGYGDDTHGGQTGHLLEDFARTGYRREDVTRVILTHAHGDHIKGNTVVEDGERRPTFPRARYYLSRRDWNWFGGARGEMHEFQSEVGTLKNVGRLALVDGAPRLTPEVSLFPTPGHTPGHISVLLESGGESAIYLGDLCHLPAHFAHPDWVSDFDTDPALTPVSRARLFELALARDALIVCPHAPSPGLGRLQRTDEGFLWQAVM